MVIKLRWCRRLGHQSSYVQGSAHSCPVRAGRRNQEFRSHLDGRGLNHRVLERYRPVMDEDVPDADIVIATWWETTEIGERVEPQKGEKIYFVQHHEIFEHLPVERCRATYRMPLRKIVIARWLADVMRDEYGDANVNLVPNAVDRQQFHADVPASRTCPLLAFSTMRPISRGWMWCWQHG